MTPDITPAPIQDPSVAASIEMGILNHDQAQPHTALDQGLPPSTSSLSTSWHPKITPYRLLNLLIPICMGTAKAVASQRSNSTAPVTLEWVSGVVVFLVLFHAGYYESEKKPPRFLAWAFDMDCMEFLWFLLGFFSVPRPLYRSDDHPESETGYIVTSYRLLVSATVASFGLTKASLSYAGFSTGSTWIEWLFGVVITSILYILGLYENSSAGVWPNFFQVGHDRTYVLRYTGKKISYTVLTGLGALFTVLALRADLIYPQNEYYGHQEPLQEHQSVYDYSLSLLPTVPKLIIGVVLLFLGFLWGLSDIPGSGLVFAKSLSFFRWISGYFHTIGHLLNLVACAICLSASVILPLALMNDRNDYDREPSDIFTDIILWLGFIGLWGFILCFMWWSVKEIGKDTAIGLRRMLFPLVFRRLAALNYAFWEMSDAFQTSPV